MANPNCDPNCALLAYCEAGEAFYRVEAQVARAQEVIGVAEMMNATPEADISEPTDRAIAHQTEARELEQTAIGFATISARARERCEKGPSQEIAVLGHVVRKSACRTPGLDILRLSGPVVIEIALPYQWPNAQQRIEGDFRVLPES